MNIVFIGVGLPGVVDTWRSKWPADELQRRGIPSYYIGHGGESTNRDWVHNETYIVHASNQDIGLYGTVKNLRQLGATVWVQFDDDYRNLGIIQDTTDPHLLELVGGLPRGLPRKARPRAWFENLTDDHRTGLAAADGLIAATEEVAEAYRSWASGPVVVIHNWIPSWITQLRPRRLSPPVAGWFGGLGAHRRDIEWLGEHARDITRFGVVGDPQGVADITGAELAHRAKWQSWTKLYREISRFSVGVVPVVNDAFNRPKSWIKPVEFAAMGIPSVTSDLPAYRRAMDQSGGFVPSTIVLTPESMVGWVNHTLDQPGWLARESERLRDVVREKFSIEGPGGDEWEKWVREYAGG